MNGKIGLSILVSFVIVFSILFILDEILVLDVHSELKSNDFFSKSFPTHKIFLIGSSHIGISNATVIKEILLENQLDYEVYNLGYNGDQPSKRIHHLPEIISLKPDLIVYGIGYRDFNQNVVDKIPPIQKILPDPVRIIDDLFSIDDSKFNEINPRLLTSQILKITYNQIYPSIKYDLINLPNTPFISFYQYDTKILNDTELQQYPEGNPLISNIDPTLENPEIFYFNEIILELENNDIPIIIFQTPINKYYLDSIPNSEKENFKKIIKNLENKHDIIIYDFSELSDLPIWKDLGHVSLNHNATVYSKKIADIILLELNS